MVVLSLFDGISCGQVALERAGIKVSKYYASEIDKHAIKVTQHNHPDTIQLGDITKWKEWDIEQPDLIMGGSPCQGFSSAGKELNFDDPRSRLFFTFVDVINYSKGINPDTLFLLENVCMKKEWENIITKYLGVEPKKINSSLVSAQNRQRLYWANWEISEPTDRKIMLTDILEDDTFYNSAGIRTRPIVTEGRRRSLCLEVNDRNKALCLVTVNLNNKVAGLPKGRYLDVNDNNYPYRNYTVTEMCRLQTLPDDYVGDISESMGAKLLGNAWTVDVIAHILKGIKEQKKDE